MKKIKTLFVLLFLLAATVANAQFANSSAVSGSISSSSSEEHWRNFVASYNSVTVDMDGMDDDLDHVNGVELGFLCGVRLSETTPFYFEGGLLANYIFGDLYDKYDVTLSTSIFSLKVPVNIGYKVDVTERFSLFPYAGIYLKGNFKGTLTFEYDGEEEEIDIFDDDEGNGKPLQFGMSIGVRCLVDNFNFGIGYGFDINELMEDTKVKSLNFSIGFNF